MAKDECKTCDNRGSPACPAGRRREDETDQQFAERQALARRMGRIAHKLLVLSGKGGVGKSTVAANLAVALARRGRRTGLLDIDLHGPSIPKLLGLEGQALEADGTEIRPATLGERLKVVSIGFMLQRQDDAVIWRGPLKMGVIRQFLKDVNWGELDYLVVDSPPGTGDEPLSICQLLEDADGAIVVTTPQDVATADVRKCITFCRKLSLPVLGVVENMSGFVCPHCGQRTELFGAGGGRRMAQTMGVPFLGAVPLDPRVVASGDEGRPFAASPATSETARAFEAVVDRLGGEAPQQEETPTMKIAIPTAEGRLCRHFGHCQRFAFITVEDGRVVGSESLAPPPHEPGVLPRWLHEQGADLVIAGGMGRRAQALFEQHGVQVVVGAPPEEPQKVVRAYLDGALQTGPNLCDH
ncbi:MAG: iron-sulfur cluster carrier protein MrpORP [Candidatus Brocadiia bacterium]